MTVRDLPTVNALLNLTATVFLVLGYRAIRRGDRARHRAMMLGAVGASALFLACYVVYHWQVGSVRYQGTGWSRTVYLVILFTHVVLAAVLPVLAGLTLVRALRERFDRHRRIARVTLPVWLYVSVTGVVVYLMLYVLG
ncbi:MAG: DUF420 domain-containing protein [Acidobacteria bacterium]|nr:DUF420 domain-containing protein [Acidobacteriota bacterium]